MYIPTNIAILQDGIDLFAFDTVQVSMSPFPRVYVIWALTIGSKDAARPGLKWITRFRFDWLASHKDCCVMYVGGCTHSYLYVGCQFFCQTHALWEKNGIDYGDPSMCLSLPSETKNMLTLSENPTEPSDEDREI